MGLVEVVFRLSDFSTLGLQMALYGSYNGPKLIDGWSRLPFRDFSNSMYEWVLRLIDWTTGRESVSWFLVRDFNFL